MPRAPLPRYRPARVRRLFSRFDLELRRQSARIHRAAHEVALDVMDRGRPLAVAVQAEAERFGTLEPFIVLAPEGLEAVRIVEAIVLAGRPREAAKVAAGIIPVRRSPHLMGGSIFLLPDTFVARLEAAAPLPPTPFPARSRIDLGPL
jgi:hypothetical protein